MFKTSESIHNTMFEEVRKDEYLAALRAPLLRYCELLSGSRHDAEDVVQTTLLKALPVLEDMKPHANVNALLRRIAKNTWLDHVRKHGKSQPCEPQLLDGLLGSRELPDLTSLEAALQVLVKILTPKQRSVLLLCDVFQYTDAEAAELLGMNRGAVKAALHRARVKLSSVGTNDEAIPPLDSDLQQEILAAYASAFHEADIRQLVQLCADGAVNPIHAMSQVLTITQQDKKTQPKRHDGMLMLVA